jgi:hypothetical protein
MELVGNERERLQRCTAHLKQKNQLVVYGIAAE